MKNTAIDALMEKYWQGESSLEEEAQLREFFYQESLPEQYESLRPLFVGVPVDAVPEISSEAEAKWLKTIDNLESPSHQGAKVIGMPQRNWWKIAAVALILIAIGTFWSQANRNLELRERQQAMVAYEETKRALAMVGIHFETGKDKTSESLNQVSKNLNIIQNK